MLAVIMLPSLTLRLVMGNCGATVTADAMQNLSGLLSAALALSSCRFSETFN